VIPEKTLQSIRADTLGFLPWGQKKEFQNGSVIKTPSDNHTFLLLANELYHILDQETFFNLGMKWNWVEDVSADVIARYPRDKKISGPEDYPSNILFTYPGSPDVYALKKILAVGSKLHIESMEIVGKTKQQNE
jgi:hypothetical protein